MHIPEPKPLHSRFECPMLIVWSYPDECFEQAIGIALDTRRLDKVDEVCNTAIKTGFEKYVAIF